ncbi:MAG: AAA family ATPase [Hyphomicrobium sp.]|nr:AAA family ATPase [Hyphomicrobium sp.]
MPASDAMIDDQGDVIAFLSDPASYDPRPANVQRIETHGAQVFLTDGDVFKIKRAVRYPYLDFSTLEKRHTACARELEINSPNAPKIYKRLAAITREADGRLAFDGRGDVVEWAVQMARFREGDVLANRIAHSPLTIEEAKSLADAVYVSHCQAAVIAKPPREASTANIAADVLTALPSLFAPPDQPAIQALATRLTALVADVQPLLTHRASEGHVRRCHGDLHLANIVLLDGAPTLFDAIEFDETLATTDTLYDLAFLLMDLDKRGQRPTANVVLNRYLWRTQDISDIEGLAALPVFLALRAAIRAMVGAQKAALASDELTEPRSYLVRAATYLRESVPALVIVGGLSGSGKSTLAAALAPCLGRAPGAVHLRSDLERKALFKAQEFDRLPEAAYSEHATAAVYQLMLRKAQSALRAGYCVIADAVHAYPSERAAMAAVAEGMGARLHTFWLEAPREILLERVANRKNDASDATPQVVERQMSYDLGQVEWTRLDASGPLEETLRTALSYLHASIGPP